MLTPDIWIPSPNKKVHLGRKLKNKIRSQKAKEAKKAKAIGRLGRWMLSNLLMRDVR